MSIFLQMVDMRIIVCLIAWLHFAAAQELPKLYEYYTEGGIQSGLEATAEGFKLNGKDISIYSGTIHYFRVHPGYWRSSLRKARAAGLVAVETYVPWNLHEPEMDNFDFGDGDNDMSMFLNVTDYIRIAQEEDLLLILRPGPYICAEWEFGGFPSWLLRQEGIVTRTSDSFYIDRVKKYFDKLLPLVADFQFTKGGPIIMFQIENEYGNFAPIDDDYKLFLKQTFEDNGLVELFVTSDNAKRGTTGAIPGALQTLNFNGDPDDLMPQLQAIQPDKPLMAMEYWSGWFTNWMDAKMDHGNSPSVFGERLEKIFKNFNGSANIYMFHGGTNFGFLSGASVTNSFPQYASDLTSYDYSALLTEAGDYTRKYELTKDIVGRYNKIQTRIPDLPEQTVKKAYGDFTVQEYLSITDIIDRVPSEDKTQIQQVKSMELLDINGGNGQSYGYVIYRKVLQLKENSVLKITGHVRDIGLLLVDGVRKTEQLASIDDVNGFGYWVNTGMEFNFAPEDSGNRTVDLLVENFSRDNSGNTHWFNPSKGLTDGPLLLDGEELSDFETISLQFKSKWVKGLNGWRAVEDLLGPALLRTTFNVEGSPADTFLDMGSWGKGIVFVNGFNIGRYLNLGPQKTLYVPAPLLKEGVNEVIIFEHYASAGTITFTDTPILG